jgi:hypothetical protein
MILLIVLAWIWFPMTMAIWTAISFIATGVYVWLRTPGPYFPGDGWVIPNHPISRRMQPARQFWH